MGIIELADDDRDGLRVFALMLFPDADDELRQQWISAQKVKQGKGVIEDLTVIIDAPSYTEIMKHTNVRLKQGQLAGTLMFHMYTMDKLGIDTSFNKAYSLIRRWAREEQYADGSAIAYSESSLLKYKVRFEPVVHLWAAYICNIYFPFYKVSDEAQDELFNNGLKDLLAVSSEFLRFGVGFRTKHAKRNYQNYDKAFKVPDTIAPISLNLNFDDPLTKKLKNNYAL